MPTAVAAQQAGPSRTSSIGEDDEERSPNGFNTSGSSFTKKLYDILDSSESCDIVCWTQDGTAFEVKEPKRLELEILPKYFRHARFQSFVRQLNFYSFKKVSKERSSWIYSHECFQRNKPDLLDRLRRKTNTSTLPSGGNVVGGEKRMYEMYATSVGMQDHEVPSAMKALRGNSAGDSVYYYGQPGGHSSSRKQQWGYEDEQTGRCAPTDPNYPGDGPNHPTSGAHQGRQQSDFKSSGERESRLSQHAVQSWDSMRLSEKQGREREREPSAQQAVSSLAFMYGIPAVQIHSTLPTTSSAVSAMGSSSDGNRSPDSDDPSEAATDNSQSSRSLCGSKTGDRGSISSVSLSSAESSHKRNHHSHHHANSAQWQAGYDQSDPRLAKIPGYQHYEQDGYSSIYPSYLPQPRPHNSTSQHHQMPFRPAAQQQHLLYAQQLNGHLPTQAQTQAQMMHARYLNYQQNVRQGQGREQGVPRVAPIMIPPSNYPSKTQPLAIATLLDDHQHWNTRPLVMKNLSPASGSREMYPSGSVENYSECVESGNNDSGLLFARTKDTVMPILISQAQAALRVERENKYVVLMPSGERSVSDGSKGLTLRVSGQMKEGSMDGEKDSYSPRVFNSMSSEDDRTSVEDDIREGKNRTEESPACGNLVLDEPLGDATHALLSFCMQRNPWMYTQPTEEDGSVNEEEGLGPNALYKDVLSCLMDTPLLREELECYSEALNPSPFPSDNRRISCSSKSYSVRRSERGSGRCQENRTGVPSEGDSSSDESTPGDLTDGSQDSDEQLSKQARSLSYCNSKMRKKDAVEEMRAFTTFASLRMQEVSDLVCGQEVRRAARRELDKQFGRNNWSRGDGTSRDEADSAAAAAFMKALETCTQTWWSYTNLHK